MRFLDVLPPNARVLADAGNPEITTVAYDSRKVEHGGLFLAIRGETTDGNRYIESAIAHGAAAVVSDSEVAAPPGVAWAAVPQGRRAMSHIASMFYGHPERKLSLSGITGTNGKTTTAFLLDSLLNSAARKTALIGTIEYRIAGKVLESQHTTPESLDLICIFKEALAAKVTDVVMEVSSHALIQGRVWGLAFDTAVFTNLTQDHLDYHKTMDAYFEAKRLLFEGTGASAPRVAVINADDPYGQQLLYARAVAEVRSYGIEVGEWRAESIRCDDSGVQFEWRTPFGSFAMESPLIGKINVYNLLAAATAAHARGLTFEQITAAARTMHSVPGRFERVDCGQPFSVVVDYAHTDDALCNVLRLARELVGDGKRVITLFGCGGDRDRAKRPKMGRAAGDASDYVIVTSDNPRSEDPHAILDEIMPGVKQTSARYTVEADRQRAIVIAIHEARPGDIVIIAGKGHEKTQTTREGVLAFDDVEVARKAIRERMEAHG